MNIKAIDHGVNIIALAKDGKRYGMCNAWAMQVSADRMLIAIGPQSVTGRMIEKGDIIGFSNLDKTQAPVAFQLGDMEKHSGEVDKLEGLAVNEDEGAITIEGAKSQVKCKVLDILALAGLEMEKVFYVEMLDGKEGDGEAMHISDLGVSM